MSFLNKRIFPKVFLTGLCVLLFISISVYSETTYIIDTPTKGMLDYANYTVDFRFFSEGGILTRMSFGVFKMVNLGVGWEVDNLVGTQNPIAAPPSLFLKIRVFDGGMVLPAFAFGYDGQGYFYNKASNEFTQKEKGIFIVFGRELFAPDLNLNAGANMNDFKENKIYGFVNAEYEIEEKFMIMGEYDNINYFPEARLNVGLRVIVSDSISIDIAGRDIASPDRKAERIVKVGYTGKF